MRLTSLLVALLFLTPAVEAEPSTMLEVVYRQQTHPEHHTHKIVWTAYKADKQHLRLERSRDGTAEFGLVVNGSDVWAWRGSSGFHTHDQGQGEAYRPLLMGVEVPTPFQGLELGNEVSFMEANQARPVEISRPDGVPSYTRSLEVGPDRLLLFVRKQGDVPKELLIFHGTQGRAALVYDSYRRDLPLDPKLFVPPSQVTWEERGDFGVDALYWASPQNTVGVSHYPVPLIYAPWEDEVAKRYKGMIARTNDDLYEDLSPCKALAEPLPQNPVMTQLQTRDPAAAGRLALAALQGPPEEPQWSILAALPSLKVEGGLDALLAIARHDPDPTDRAFAWRELARRRQTESLTEGLFDDAYSVRLLCAQLLAEAGSPTGDGLLALPLQPRNPFHLFFLSQALERQVPREDVLKYLDLGGRERQGLVPLPCRDAYLQLALRYKQRPAAALTIYLLGDKNQVEQALTVLEQTLLEQGRRPDLYHSPDFWLRGDIIQVFRSDPGKVPLLRQMLRRHLAAYSSQKDMILLALAYAFSRLGDPSVEGDLLSFRSLKTDNYDLYTAAALGLAGIKSPQAFPSLLHVLNLCQQNRRHPFGEVAVRALEKLTGITTPGKPEDLGVLHNLGLPKAELDLDATAKFWNEWYKNRQETLRLDPASGRFR